MAFVTYTPTTTTWWDIVGTPLFIPGGSGDVYTYDNQDLSTVASNPGGYTQQGFKGKTLDNLAYLKTQIQPTGGIVLAQEMRVINKLIWSDTAASSSARYGNQSATATTGTIPAVFSRSVIATDWWWLALDLPNGAKVTSVNISTLGSGSDAFGFLTAPPLYSILSYKAGVAETYLSANTNDAHIAANWTTTVVATSITPTATLTVDRTLRYALYCQAPKFSTSSSGLEVRGLSVTMT